MESQFNSSHSMNKHLYLGFYGRKINDYKVYPDFNSTSNFFPITPSLDYYFPRSSSVQYNTILSLQFNVLFSVFQFSPPTIVQRINPLLVVYLVKLN